VSLVSSCVYRLASPPCVSPRRFLSLLQSGHFIIFPHGPPAQHEAGCGHRCVGPDWILSVFSPDCFVCSPFPCICCLQSSAHPTQSLPRAVVSGSPRACLHNSTPSPLPGYFTACSPSQPRVWVWPSLSIGLESSNRHLSRQLTAFGKRGATIHAYTESSVSFTSHALSSQVFSRPACTTPAFGPPHFRSSPQRLQASHQVTSLQSSTTSPSSLRRIGGVFTSHPSCSHPVPLAPHTASHRPRVWHRVSTSVCPIRAAVKSLRCHAAALGLLGHHTATTQICARCSLASARPRPLLGSLRPLLITLGELPPLHFSHDNQRGLHSRTEAQVRFRALVTQRVVCFFVFPSAFFPSSVFSPLG
jgi:hypothetical protein